MIYDENKYLLIYRLGYVVHFSNNTMIQIENTFNGFRKNYCVCSYFKYSKHAQREKENRIDKKKF